MVRKWGTPWYAIGIGGTIVFMAIWIITRMPGNPITGRGGPAGNPVAISVEVFEAAFIGLAAAIILYERREMKRLQSQYAEKNKPVHENAKKGGQRQVSILAGIVIALILIGSFALPALMPNPMGSGPPPGGGQFGAPQGQSPGQQTSTGAGNST